MKITYYRTHYNGYTIFADFVDTEDTLHYVSHDDNSVTISVAGTDADGYDDSENRVKHVYFRRFEDEKADTLNRLKSHVFRMQRLVDDLDASTHALNEKA